GIRVLELIDEQPAVFLLQRPADVRIRTEHVRRHDQKVVEAELVPPAPLGLCRLARFHEQRDTPAVEIPTPRGQERTERRRSKISVKPLRLSGPLRVVPRPEHHAGLGFPRSQEVDEKRGVSPTAAVGTPLPGKPICSLQCLTGRSFRYLRLPEQLT